jgi:uncharacterized RDD family membrane protein YckC
MTQVVNAYSIAYPPAAFAGVRTRRLAAWGLDLAVVALMTGLVWLASIFLTFGLSLFILPPLFPVIAVLYYAITVSGSGRGTLGMRAFDLEVAMHATGTRAPFVNAAAQSILFYVSWAFPLLFVATLVDSEKRFLHDMLSALVVVRRPN